MIKSIVYLLRSSLFCYAFPSKLRIIPYSTPSVKNIFFLFRSKKCFFKHVCVMAKLTTIVLERQNFTCLPNSTCLFWPGLKTHSQIRNVKLMFLCGNLRINVTLKAWPNIVWQTFQVCLSSKCLSCHYDKHCLTSTF